MKKTIEIETDDGGLQLYNSAPARIKAYSDHLDNIRKYMENVEKVKKNFPTSKNTLQYDNYYSMLEFLALINISTLDLVVISRQLSIAKSKWENFFCGKHAYSIIYETIISYHELTKRMKKMIDDGEPNMKSHFVDVSKDIRAFKKTYKYDSTINDVRNHTAAHVGNFKRYYEIAISLDSKIVLDAIIAFIQILSKLADLCTLLLESLKFEDLDNK